MPTDEENVQYLYLVLTAGGTPTIDMSAIGKALDLKPGATSKRWSRLQQAMKAGKNPGPTAYEFLWLCVKHSTRDKAMDWADIASKCGTTPGAASKRYSRMKQAFDRGDAAPTTPSKPKNASASPNGTTPSSKRKRAPATPKRKTAAPEEKFKPEGDQDDDEDEFEDKKPKRAKGAVAKPRATPKPKPKAKGEQSSVVVKEEPDQPHSNNHLPTPTLSGSVNPTEATRFVKTDPDATTVKSQGPLYGTPIDDGEEQFYDANEVIAEYEEAATQESELPNSMCALCECRGNWVAGFLANQIGEAGVDRWLEEI